MRLIPWTHPRGSEKKQDIGNTEQHCGLKSKPSPVCLLPDEIWHKVVQNRYCSKSTVLCISYIWLNCVDSLGFQRFLVLRTEMCKEHKSS
jgi:hypothetical protein